VTAPGHEAIREVQRRLRAQDGDPEPLPPAPILDQVVGTVLSQHTSDVNSGRAFARLKARFPAWEQAAHAPVGEIEDAIRCGGLARLKARRIKEILDVVDEREGRADLSRLHDLDDAAAESYLTSLPGVGVKTAACVLAFSMGRAAFPVDTHVHRVVTRLGWIPAGTTAEKAYRLLAPRVPADIRCELHLALIRHGRTVCLARRPRCEACVLLSLCPYGRRQPALGAAASTRSPYTFAISAQGSAYGPRPSRRCCQPRAARMRGRASGPAPRRTIRRRR
jgi:endonuclease-3